MVEEQVMGVTDVDDKIINRAAEQGRHGTTPPPLM